MLSCSQKASDFDNLRVRKISTGKLLRVGIIHVSQTFGELSCSNARRNVRTTFEGVMNGPLKFLTAGKSLPLLDLLAKFKQVLACLCSPNFCSCLQARRANLLFLLVLTKKSQCSACSRMLAKTIRHPYLRQIKKRMLS